uniref:Ycf36 n=1 Tax=Dicranema revolutum TaxID=239144 RepID=A0A4D6WUZ6_9FLOR|nr:hypothetical protein [Dicranema revolutum]
MCATKKFCPVPFDQQPLNEYFALKKSCFFAWSIFSNLKYIKIICIMFICLLILLCPLAFLINTNYILQIILYDLLLVTFIFILIFTRLYLGWSYIIKRLMSATVFYEESGWYDGQVWVKPVEYLTKDRLIGLYEVNPFIVRVKYSLFLFVILCFFESLVLYLI